MLDGVITKFIFDPLTPGAFVVAAEEAEAAADDARDGLAVAVF